MPRYDEMEGWRAVVWIEGMHSPSMMSFMTDWRTTSSKMFSTRMNLEKSSKINSWNLGSS